LRLSPFQWCHVFAPLSIVNLPYAQPCQKEGENKQRTRVEIVFPQVEAIMVNLITGSSFGSHHFFFFFLFQIVSGKFVLFLSM
jgi:hypothetical protein